MARFLSRLLRRPIAADQLPSRTVTARVYDGYDTLEVVGESHYQDALWRIVGGLRGDPIRFDTQAVLRSLAKTNRLAVVEEGPLTGGWAGEVLSVAIEQGLGDIDDAWRITTPDGPVPYSPPLEDDFLPGATRIAQEIRSRS